MQKLYLLLRNNQQTGPYTIDEILQLNLKPFDLVWVDGRSAAWRYPSEIESLKPFVAEVPKPKTPFEPVSTAAMDKKSNADFPSKNEVSKNVFVSLPPRGLQVPKEIYSIEEPKETPFIATPHTSTHLAPADNPGEQTTKTNYTKSLHEVENDYTKWVYEKKTAKKGTIAKKDLAIAIGILVIIVAGYYIMSKPSLVSENASAVSSVPSSYTRDEQRDAPTESVETPIKEQLPAESKPVVNEMVEKKTAIPPSKTPRPSHTTVLPVTDLANKDDSRKEEIKPVVQDQSQDLPQQKAETTTTNKKEKKKFGEVIRGIFSKKEKAKDPEILEEPKPATNRQATRRNEEVKPEPEELSSSEALASQIDISSNAPDNWMMGISGLKVTLRNRSNLAVKTAAIQVLYLGEDKQVLDKKTIYFNNIPAKGKLTLPAPDHKFAEQVEFKLVAVTAKEDTYARN